MNGFTVKTRREVILRDEKKCQWCGREIDLSWEIYSLQHRRARGMGGSRLPDTSSHANAVLMHGTGTLGCHGYIESHRVEATRRGFIIPQGKQPHLIPLQDSNGWWWLLGPQGGRTCIQGALAAEYMALAGLIPVPESAP